MNTNIMEFVWDKYIIENNSPWQNKLILLCSENTFLGMATPMEPDRYQENKLVFIVAMICLLISLTLITLSLYLFPFLFFKWVYQVPAFIPDFLEWLNDTYALSGTNASLFVFLIFFIPGVAAGIISKIASNSIENHIYGLVEKKEHNHEHIKAEVKASFGFGFKLFIIIICAVLVLFFVQWLIQSPVPNA